MHLPTFLEFRQAVADKDTKLANQLRNRLVVDNMPLVAKLAHRFIKGSSTPGELEDLMQAGAAGLMRALESYDPEKSKFSTYAAWWIRSELQQSSAKQPVVYRPRTSGKPYKAHALDEKIQTKEGREATAEEMGVSQKEVDSWARYASHTVSFDEIQALAAGGAASLTLHDVVATPEPENPQVEHHLEIIRGALAELGKKERAAVIGMLDGKDPKEIARVHGLTPERVTRIYEAVLITLKEELL